LKTLFIDYNLVGVGEGGFEVDGEAGGRDGAQKDIGSVPAKKNSL
jgi:hypothetical protein